jgi:pyruvate/2-oxoacid:ferredoxin oxidoreductase alpha subunit
LITVKRLWPFPEKELRKALMDRNVEIAVVEMNQGQLAKFVKPIFPSVRSLSQNTGSRIEPRRIKKYLETKEWEK